MGRKLLKTVKTITTFRNPLADPVGTRRGPPLVRGPQFENRWLTRQEAQLSPSDRAMRLVSSNLANYHATVQKLLIQQVLTKPMV